jgi:hypothetical protein
MIVNVFCAKTDTWPNESAANRMAFRANRQLMRKL